MLTTWHGSKQNWQMFLSKLNAMQLGVQVQWNVILSKPIIIQSSLPCHLIFHYSN